MYQKLVLQRIAQKGLNSSVWHTSLIFTCKTKQKKIQKSYIIFLKPHNNEIFCLGVSHKCGAWLRPLKRKNIFFFLPPILTIVSPLLMSCKLLIFFNSSHNQNSTKSLKSSRRSYKKLTWRWRRTRKMANCVGEARKRCNLNLIWTFMCASSFCFCFIQW